MYIFILHLHNKNYLKLMSCTIFFFTKYLFNKLFFERKTNKTNTHEQLYGISMNFFILSIAYLF